MQGTCIKWAYYCTFRSPIAPDLGSTEQDKPVLLPGNTGERSTVRRIDGGAGRRSERKRMLLCNGADIGCVCSIDYITERESGQTSPWCCTRENLINRLMRQSR